MDPKETESIKMALNKRMNGKSSSHREKKEEDFETMYLAERNPGEQSVENKLKHLVQTNHN